MGLVLVLQGLVFAHRDFSQEAKLRRVQLAVAVPQD